MDSDTNLDLDSNKYIETNHDINITIIDRSNEAHVIAVPTDIELSLMELCKASDLPVLGTCGGMALCASCHIYIESDNMLSPPSEEEEIMLDQVAAYQPNSRLGCQIKINENCDGLVVRLAKE